MQREREFRANEQVGEPGCELTWLKLLLKEMDVYQGDPLIMHCDNESAMNIDCRKSYVSRAYQTYRGRLSFLTIKGYLRRDSNPV